LCSNPPVKHRPASPIAVIRFAIRAASVRAARHRLLLAILCAVCMLGAQQAAYAHHVGHIGSTTQAAPAPADDNGDAQFHACASCAVFAGLAAAPPAYVSLIAAAHGVATLLPDIPTAYIAARSALPYTARAPPAVL
jgi:hypothetical protein